MVPSVDPRIGVPRRVRAIDMGCQHGLPAKMQRGNATYRFAGGAMMLRQIIDEDRLGRIVFVEDLLQRRSLGPLVRENARIQAMVGQLLGAHLLALVDEVGQDDDIGFFAKRVDPFDRTGDWRLPVHFGVEELASSRASLCSLSRKAICASSSEL